MNARDEYVIAKALWLAVQHIDGLPPEQRAASDQEDMRRLLETRYPDFERMFVWQHGVAGGGEN